MDVAVFSSTQGIIFDKDGTLFDFEESWNNWTADFLVRFCGTDRKRAIHVGERIGFDFVERCFHRQSKVIAGTPEELISVLTEEFPNIGEEDILQELVEFSSSAMQVEAVALEPLLSHLHNCGYVLGVATNDAVQIASEQLRLASVLSYFDFVVGYDSGFEPKPDPSMLLAFCRTCGVAHANTVMVGDSLFDLIAGRRAGIPTIGVLTCMATAEELAPYSDAVIADIGELPSLLASD